MRKHGHTTPAGILMGFVDLVVVFDDGVTQMIPIVWRNGMTVLDALKRASKNEHGIPFRSTGSGARSFVTAIDGQANDENAHYWMFTVNGEMPDVGCGEYVLKPGDTARWDQVPFLAELARS